MSSQQVHKQNITKQTQSCTKQLENIVTGQRINATHQHIYDMAPTLHYTDDELLVRRKFSISVNVNYIGIGSIV